MPDADQLKAYLAERDAPCPGCGYNLRGVAEPVCPECGIPLDVQAIKPPAFFAPDAFGGIYIAWITFLGLVLIGGLFGASRVHHYYRREQLMIVFTTLAVTLVPLVVSVMIRRRAMKNHVRALHLLEGVVLFLPVVIFFACVALFAVRFGRFW